MKSFGVVPLTWVTPPTDTRTPVVVNDAVRPVTLTPGGTATAIEVPVIVEKALVTRPALGFESKPKVVMSLGEPKPWVRWSVPGSYGGFRLSIQPIKAATQAIRELETSTLCFI